MNWFFVALGAPILFAIVNHLDKYLLSKYFKGNRVGALFIFSTLISIVILPILYLVRPAVFHVSLGHALVLIVSGIFYSLAVLLYLYALERSEASIVSPLFQITPVFSFVLAFSFLGERLTAYQLLGAASVIVGSILISLDFSKKIRLQKKILLFMATASFLLATSAIVYKFAALEEGFVVASFWEYVGFLIVGGCSFIFIPLYRKQFLTMMRSEAGIIIGLNVLGEFLTFAGNLLINFALLIVPVALVSSVTNLQPFFVFVFGVILTLFFPTLGKEVIQKKNLIQKIIAIAVIILGSYFLY